MSLSTEPISVTADGQLFRKGDWLYWTYLDADVKIISINDSDPFIKVITVRSLDDRIYDDLSSRELKYNKRAMHI